MMKEKFGKRIADFWNGLLNSEQQKGLLSDLEEHEPTLQSKLKREFSSDDDQNEKLLSDAAYQAVLDALHRKMGIVKEPPAKRRLRIHWPAAAALLLFVLSTGLILLHDTFSAGDDADSNFLVNTDTIHLMNHETILQKTVLADGSIVILSPGSKLTFLRNFAKEDRVLYLMGQGRFQVAHDSLRPFIVWANGFTTTALGTEFTIDAQSAEKIDVALLSGKIVVKATEQSLLRIADQYLLPGDSLAINIMRRSFTLIPASAEIPTSPKNVKTKILETQSPPLVFDETPLSTVFAYIAARKNVQITTDAALNLEGLSFTGEFSDSEAALSIIHIICQLNDLQYAQQEQQIIIKQKIDPLFPVAE